MAERSIGPVRQRAGGDTLQAKVYTNIAKTQLGILKNLMSFNDLKQLSRTVYLGDGTRIFVSSVFGQDSIRIDTPEGIAVGEGREVEKRGKKILIRVSGLFGVSGEQYFGSVAFDIENGDSWIDWQLDYAVIGISPGSLAEPDITHRNVQGGADGNSLAWGERRGSYGLTDRVLHADRAGGISIILDYSTTLQDTIPSNIYISRDGTTVTYIAMVDSGRRDGSGNPIWRNSAHVWDKTHGVRKIDTGFTGVFKPEGAFYELNYYNTCAISADGSAVTFYMCEARADLANYERVFYRWTEETGAIKIHSGYTEPTVATGPIRISDDGTVVAFITDEYYTAERQLRIWEKNSGTTVFIAVNIGYPRTLQMSSDGNSIICASDIRTMTVFRNKQIKQYVSPPGSLVDYTYGLHLARNGSSAVWRQYTSQSHTYRLNLLDIENDILVEILMPWVSDISEDGKYIFAWDAAGIYKINMLQETNAQGVITKEVGEKTRVAITNIQSIAPGFISPDGSTAISTVALTALSPNYIIKSDAFMSGGYLAKVTNPQ